MVTLGLKARYVDVYLPSEAAKRQWEEDAKKVSLPLSKFVFEVIEAFRAANDGKPRSDLIKELAEIKEDAQKLRGELKLKNMLLEKLEGKVYKARYDSFKEVELGEGSRHHDEELIKILKNGKAIEGYAILEKLGINPRDSEAVKLVNNQLESLRHFGLVEETANGLRWVK
jgi:hypothetical protein